jgi:CHASE2 domain-containing sensor protein
MKARIKAAIFGAFLAVGSGYLCLTTPLGDGLVLASYDLPFKFRPFIFPKEVVIVYLDDASHEKLHQKYTEVWNRGYYTKLLTRLTADHAKAVVFDIIFSDAMDPATDQAFAKAMEANGNVVIGAELATVAYGPHVLTEIHLMPPAKIFAESAADLGLDGVFADQDLEIRSYLPTTKYAGQSSPTPMASEAWAGATLADPTLLTNKTLQDTTFWMNYYGPEMMTLPFVSLYQALADSDPNVPPGCFSNKVVFVGERLQTQLVGNRKDEYTSPYSWIPQNRFMSGVGIQATACLNLIRGDYLRRLDWGTERTIILLLGVLFGAGLVLFRPIPAVMLALFSAILIALLDYLCFVKLHYWFPCLIPILVQIPVALVWSVAAHSVQLSAQLRSLQNPQN